MQVTDSDAQLQLKKRARRRLVGAVAFVTFAAIVLPMVMDQAPPPPAADIQIRIPGQDQPPLQSPSLNTPAKPAAAVAPAAAPADTAPLVAVAPAADTVPVPKTPEKVADKPAPAKAPEKVAEKPAEKPVEKPADKPSEKTSKTQEKPAEKPAAKAQEKSAEKEKADKDKAEKEKAEKAKAKAEADAEAKRAAALLGGSKGEAGKPAATGGQHVILIGAFANAGNVKILQTKLNEIGVKTYTETLESPQGTKTRVRAGPFANKDAADKALEKMKKIGVNGIVAAK